MKLPKFLRPAAAERAALESSSVTISADTLAVAPYREGELTGEHRRVILTSPAGISAVPATGAEVLAAPVGADTLLLGCVDGAAAKRITLTVGRSTITITDSGISMSCGAGYLSITPAGVSHS